MLNEGTTLEELQAYDIKNENPVMDVFLYRKWFTDNLNLGRSVEELLNDSMFSHNHIEVKAHRVSLVKVNGNAVFESASLDKELTDKNGGVYHFKPSGINVTKAPIWVIPFVDDDGVYLPNVMPLIVSIEQVWSVIREYNIIDRVQIHHSKVNGQDVKNINKTYLVPIIWLLDGLISILPTEHLEVWIKDKKDKNIF